MYNITVESDLFTGKTRVQQHKMVTTCLAEELKSIHGYNLKTKSPDAKPATEEIKVEKKKTSS
jgi:stress-induced morphogen